MPQLEKLFCLVMSIRKFPDDDDGSISETPARTAILESFLN